MKLRIPVEQIRVSYLSNFYLYFLYNKILMIQIFVKTMIRKDLKLAQRLLEEKFK